MNRLVLTDAKKTKHNIAEKIAQIFPEELSSYLPPERKAWMSEDPRLYVFEAVAMALTFEH
jgi:hypothetical protein